MPVILVMALPPNLWQVLQADQAPAATFNNYFQNNQGYSADAPVSHGCIRLGIGLAKAIYDWVDVGTRVVISKPLARIF